MQFVHSKLFLSCHVSLPLLIILPCPLRVYVCRVSYERSSYVFMISTVMPYLQDSISQYDSPVTDSYISFVP